ncbi:MAG: glycerol-3-phosphate 1-O-acyltransferase PlsY [Methylobacterium mesophilicum]|nr:glycerol-3-phosphate 1-O-acyltransferase PlsY [Methylobacterium mesophilicum]
MSQGFGLLLAAFVFGYLLGSIPFGLVLTRLAGMGDVRKIGSGNIGATNVLRTGNKKLAAATLLLDAFKGTVAVLLANHFFGLEAGLAAGFGAFLGHLFPVWLGFKGGKGVATYLGLLLAMCWQAALVFALVWLAAAFAFRYSSLAALLGVIAAPLAALYFGTTPVAALLAVMSLIVFLKHHANIRRLLAGTESRIGAKG